MTPRVKICGMTNPDDIGRAAAARADAIGLIAEVPVDTPREITPDRARELAATVPPFVTSVLVTMPQSGDARALVDHVRPDAVQLHGDVSDADVAAVREVATVIRAVDAGKDEAIRTAAAADAILLDSTGPDSGGGTGETHDWDRARDYVEELDVPVILAGGLTPENVGAAVETVQPYGVDVASGVEGPDGKDHDAIAGFVAAAKGGPA